MKTDTDANTTRRLLPVTIRPWNHGDMLDALWIDSASRELAWTYYKFAGALRKGNGGAALVAEYRRQMVGFIVYVTKPSVWLADDQQRRGRLEILRFATHPDLRRKGVMSQLISRLAIDSNLADVGPLMCNLELSTENVPAARFLEWCGFRWSDCLWNYHGDGKDCIKFKFTAEAN